MLTTWQEELWLKEQSHITELSNPFLLSDSFQFPFPLQGSTPKSQSFFPILFPISFNAFTAKTIQMNQHRRAKNQSSLEAIYAETSYNQSVIVSFSVQRWKSKSSSNLMKVVKDVLN